MSVFRTHNVTSDDATFATLAGRILPPGTQVTGYDNGLVVMHYPLPGFLPVTVRCLPRRRDQEPAVHLYCNRMLAATEVAGLTAVLQAADAWRQLGSEALGPHLKVEGEG